MDYKKTMEYLSILLDMEKTSIFKKKLLRICMQNAIHWG